MILRLKQRNFRTFDLDLVSRQGHSRSRPPKGTSPHYKLSFDISHLNILAAVFDKSVLTFLTVRTLEKKLFDPYKSP